jgi:hypothetical protein
MNKDACEAFYYRGMDVRIVTYDNPGEHHNQLGEMHNFDTVWFAHKPDMHVVVARCPHRAGGEYWLLDSKNYRDANSADFFHDKGPYPTLEAALDELYLLAVATRLGDKTYARKHT